ncbi:TPA: hypothetical protein ACKFAD_004117 [Citrobacter koseri]
MSNVVKELSEYKLDGFAELLNQSLDDDEALDILNKMFSTLTTFIIHPSSKRKKRDDFIDSLRSIFPDGFDNSIRLIDEKVNVIKNAEELFDSISDFINECVISSLPIDTQLWSHIERAKAQQLSIRQDVERSDSKKNISSLSVKVRNEQGVLYNPDAATENNIKYLTLTLKLLAFRNGWGTESAYIFPSKVDVSEDNTEQAGAIELLARSWLSLEDIAKRSILFNGHVNITEEENIGNDLKNNGVKKAYHFDRNECKIEYFDSIACERVKKALLQNLVSTIKYLGLDKKIKSNSDKTFEFEDKTYLFVDEILTHISISEVFCCDTHENDAPYNGLFLREWIRGYFALKSFSENHSEDNNIFSYDEILTHIVNSGLSHEKAEIFINICSFAQNSKDLFDTPLLRLNENKVYIFSYLLKQINISQVIMSRMSSLETDNSKKGLAFEKTTHEMLRNAGIDSKTFQFKRDEQYEYDAVFILNNKIFILECKNRSLCWSDPIKLHRQGKFIEDAIYQVLRLKNALVQHPEVIREHFNVNIEDYEIIPIIFNRMPFSWEGPLDGVYISDYSSLSRFLKSSHINKITTKSDVVTKTRYKQWKGEVVTAEDLLNHLKSPLQLKPFKNTRVGNGYWWVGNNEKAFTVVEYEFNHNKYRENEMRLLSIPSSKAKENKNIKKNKRKLARKSKRANRKK